MLRKRNNRASRNRFFGAVLARRVERGGAALSVPVRTARRRTPALVVSQDPEPALARPTPTREEDGLVLDMSTAERLCNGADLVMDVTVSDAPSLSGDNVL
ncbi:hypothetical protein MRX96_056388 [Rhipicephalus microplus]